MASTGLGIAVIPSLMGVLARQISLEIIPISLFVVYLGLLGVYLLAIKSPKMKTANTPAPIEQIAQ
jgi:hypothetical protein